MIWEDLREGERFQLMLQKERWEVKQLQEQVFMEPWHLAVTCTATDEDDDDDDDDDGDVDRCTLHWMLLWCDVSFILAEHFQNLVVHRYHTILIWLCDAKLECRMLRCHAVPILLPMLCAVYICLPFLVSNCNFALFAWSIYDKLQECILVSIQCTNGMHMHMMAKMKLPCYILQCPSNLQDDECQDLLSS